MEIVTQLLSVALVIGLLVAAVWFVRRGGGLRVNLTRKPAGGRLLEPLERLTLTPQHTLHLVRVGDQAVLVAAHASGCSVIESRPWGELDKPDRSAALERAAS